MENKYYTPDIEDIHIGYSCEFLKGIGMDSQKLWHPVVISESMLPSILRDYKLLRTPFLTKEQIEKEGWEYLAEYRDGTTIYSNKGYELIFKGIKFPEILIEKVWKNMDGKRLSDQLYKGNCPSINEFRKICKLLKIK